MIYVMSDLHGCYEKYKGMLKKINFSENDTLYILGDVIDRGENGIEILFDMMCRDNVIPMLGNHEFMAYGVLKKLNVKITEENFDTHLDSDVMAVYETWMMNGGAPTLRAFSKLSADEKADIIQYIREFELYEELELNGNKFVLVHGGLYNFSMDKELSEYDIDDMLWGRCDYAKKYYPDKYLVTGHTPTCNINPEYKGKIFRGNNHIAIDCGTIICNTLGCLCLDTLEEFYIN